MSLENKVNFNWKGTLFKFGTVAGLFGGLIGWNIYERSTMPTEKIQFTPTPEYSYGFPNEDFEYQLVAKHEDSKKLKYSLVNFIPLSLSNVEVSETGFLKFRAPKTNTIDLGNPGNNVCKFMVRAETENGEFNTWKFEVNIVNLENYVDMGDTWVALDSFERYDRPIEWGESHLNLKERGGRMITPQEYIAFLNRLKSGKAKDGLGNDISKEKLNQIYKNLTEKIDPTRGEWIDARFYLAEDKVGLSFMHRVNVNGSLDGQGFVLGNYLKINKKISFEEWLQTTNQSGLPSENIKDGQFYFTAPVPGKVMMYCVDSNSRALRCDWLAEDSFRHMSVRLVYDK